MSKGAYRDGLGNCNGTNFFSSLKLRQVKGWKEQERVTTEKKKHQRLFFN